MPFPKRCLLAVLGSFAALQLAACTEPQPVEPEPEPSPAPDFAFVGELHNEALARALARARSGGSNPCELALAEIERVSDEWPGGGLQETLASGWGDPQLMSAAGCGSAPVPSLVSAGSEMGDEISSSGARLVRRIMAAVDAYPEQPVDAELRAVERDAMALEAGERELLLALASLTRASAEFWEPSSAGGAAGMPGLESSEWDDPGGARMVVGSDVGGCLGAGLWGLRGGLQAGAAACFIGGTTASITAGVAGLF